MSQEHASHENLAREHFAADAGIMQQINELGMTEYVDDLENVEKAFMPEDTNVRCIDEGTEGGIPLAGSGILLGAEKTVAFFKKKGVEGVYSHAGCGAAALYCQQNGIDPSKAEEEAIKFAGLVAEKAGIKYMGHISLQEMARPADLHTARVAFVDGTDRFDPKDTEGFPTGFTINRRSLDLEYVLAEAKVACEIALGDHGFGELFTEDNPFVLIAVGDPFDENFSEEAIKAELEKVAEPFGGRVKVDGFTAPKF